MQAASTLATAHYPETLGRTYVSLIIVPPPTIYLPERTRQEEHSIERFSWAGHWSANFLPHNLGLDKNLV
jgi:hypothetical protein